MERVRVHQVANLANKTLAYIKALDKVEQNIVICQWRADQLSAEAECWAK